MSPENLMPPSAITGTPARRGDARGVEHRGELRHADAGDDARRADRAGPDADLDRRDARLDQRLGALGRRDVAADDRQLREAAPQRPRPSRARRCEWPCAVSTTIDVDAGARRAPRRARASSSPTPTAAPQRSRPSASLHAFGKRSVFSMSLIVIRPRSVPSASTTSSFSIRCWCRSSFARSRSCRAAPSRGPRASSRSRSAGGCRARSAGRGS